MRKNYTLHLIKQSKMLSIYKPKYLADKSKLVYLPNVRVKNENESTEVDTSSLYPLIIYREGYDAFK